MACRHIKIPKATSYALFKSDDCLEGFLFQIKNKKYRTALSHFRLSLIDLMIDLMIEKGRPFKPEIDKNEKSFCRYRVDRMPIVQ